MPLKLPFVLPTSRVALDDLTIELWVSQRKLPMLLRADSIVVPVGPDLKMVFGIAKMVRDYGADIVQHEAASVAPLEPGDAFVGTGARFRYKYTALAVIFDNYKRTSPDLISRGVVRAMRLLRERGAKSVVFPDMTENLLAQPNWITDEQRRETAKLTARLMIDAVVTGGVPMRTVRIWVWDRTSADAFKSEMDRLRNRRRAALAADA